MSIRTGFRATNPIHFSFLQYAKKFGLSGEVQIADFIEE
jgi:hypothetical protein